MRALIITEVVRKLRKVVETFSPKSLLGAFLFPPSIARSVGQRYEVLADYLDFVSPMIYTSGKGSACLNAEIASLARALTKVNHKIQEGKILEACYRRLGMHGEDPPRTLEELGRTALPPWIVKTETQFSRSMLGQSSTLVPILMLSSQATRTRKESEYAREAQADGISFFQYAPNRVRSLKEAIEPWTASGQSAKVFSSR